MPRLRFQRRSIDQPLTRWLACGLFAATLGIHPVHAQESLDHPDDAELAERLDALAGQKETPQRREWVNAILQHEERSFIPHPEYPQVRLPRYQIRARAQRQLQRWAEERAWQAWQQNRGLHGKALADPALIVARQRWLQQVAHSELQLWRTQNHALELDETAMRILVQRLNRLDDWLLLVRSGQDRQTLEQLQRAPQQLSPDALDKVLRQARENPALGRMAARLQGHQARSDGARAAHLRAALLNQPLSAGNVEAALAAELPDLVALFGAQLDDPATAALAAYGLWRQNSASAVARLRDYLEQAHALPELQREIQAWLQ